PTLAQAYRYTGDATYLKRICEAVDSWFGSELPARSTSWDADLAVAMRAVSILYTLSLLPQSALPAESRHTMTRIILLSGSILELIVRRPSFNHWVVNAFGLFCCGLAAKEIEAGRRWMRAGVSILGGQLARQFFADGVHGERSPGYMRLVVE